MTLLRELSASFEARGRSARACRKAVPVCCRGVPKWKAIANLARAAALAAALAPFSASRAESTLPRATPSADSSWREGLRFQLAVEGAHDVSFEDADVSWLRTSGLIALQGPLSERWSAGVSVSAELLSPEVDGDASFLAATAGGGDALRDLFESNLRAGARMMIRQRWSLGAEGYLTAKLEPGADFGDGLKGGTLLGFGYRPSDAFDLMAGVKLGSRLDRPGVHAWPMLRMEWQITDRLELDLRNANLRLVFELRDGLELFGFGGARSDRYRLERRALGPLASEPGTLGIRDATVGAGLSWIPNEHLRVVGTLGTVVWQKLSVNDADADRIESRTSDGAAPIASLRIQARF